MNVDLITRDDFERFKTELINEIRMFQVNNQRPEEKGKAWLKSNDVRKLLNISIGTLQNLRLKGTLPFSKIGGLLYYKYEDILKLMDSKTDTE
ncbi:helix-turn-helix domain-containing protein [Flavobacterium sp. RNTU_13]|uniref:helix-turn-helix domain-containing protein n=1 Tax=Flavobacterium sp. RNTU_13 TaxID=3375145 RepID=UPI003985F7A1